MVAFLSDAWVDALDEAARVLEVDPITELCVEHHVDGFVYHVTYTGGRVRFRHGAAPEPTTRIHLDRASATAIARGEQSAQRAFMQGSLHIDGDTLALASSHGALRALGDAFAEVRARTEW